MSWWWESRNRRESQGDAFLTQALTQLATIIVNQRKIMHTLDEVLADVKEADTKVDSLSALIAGLRQQVKDVSTGISPEVQRKIDEVFDAAEAHKTRIQGALDANVPAPTGTDTSKAGG